MQLHRLGFMFGASTLLLLGAYACSSDDDNSGGGTDAGTDARTDTGPIETPDTGPGPGPVLDAGDAGSGLDAAVPMACIGNPLSADGGGGAVNLDGGQLYQVATGNFLYGPQYVDELGGQIIYTSFDDHTVVRTSPDGGGGVTELIDLGGEPFDLNQSTYWNGNVYTALAYGDTDGGGAIYRLPLDGGAGTAIIPLSSTKYTSPNGIAITKTGTTYIADPNFQFKGTAPHQGLGKINIDGGSPGTVATDHQFVGLALNKDESKLFASVVDQAQIWWYPLDTNGNTTGAATIFPTLTRYTPAGIAVDQGGNVWVAEYDTTANGAVEVFNPDGSKVLATVYLTGQHATGVAFGGSDRTMVFITTENGNLLKMSTRCPGNL